LNYWIKRVNSEELNQPRCKPRNVHRDDRVEAATSRHVVQMDSLAEVFSTVTTHAKPYSHGSRDDLEVHNGRTQWVLRSTVTCEPNGSSGFRTDCAFSVEDWLRRPASRVHAPVARCRLGVALRKASASAFNKSECSKFSTMSMTVESCPASGANPR